jgi:soluble lytic murein transglycosylase-like protein
MNRETEVFLLFALVGALILWGGVESGAAENIETGVEDIVSDLTGGLTALQKQIVEWAKACGQDPALVLAFCQVESSFNPQAYRAEPKIHDASYGLMQILYQTAISLGFAGTADQLFDPQTNVLWGCQALNYFQSKGFSLPAEADIYNVGETLWRKGVRNAGYQQKIQSAYEKWRGLGV